tara:strand:+ start:14240 stop:14692 length:453 start_codon:yes stop_codon:yes gene_type:complete
MANQLLLGGDDDLIVIELHYQVKKNKHGQRQFRILSDEDVEKMPKPKEGEEKAYETLETKWRPQTWQTNNELLKNSMSYNKVSGGSELDWSAYQQNVFRYCLSAWNVTDGEGRPVPPSIENVGMLPSNVARALIQRYDEALMIDEDEKKE